MEKITVTLTAPEWALIEQMIVAGGKSPATGVAGLAQSMQALQLLHAGRRVPDNVVPLAPVPPTPGPHDADKIADPAYAKKADA